MPRARVAGVAAAFVMAGAVVAACGGGGTKTATPAASPTRVAASPTAAAQATVTPTASAVASATGAATGQAPPPQAYFAQLQTLMGEVEQVLGAGAGEGGAVGYVQQLVPVMETLQDALAKTTPPADAASAHQRLSQAAQALIEAGRRQQQAPTNDATAIADVLPMLADFQRACASMQIVAGSQGIRIDLHCDGA
jgi:hypothetical protein